MLKQWRIHAYKCIANKYEENNTYQLVEKKRKIVIPGKDIHPLLLSFFFLENTKWNFFKKNIESRDFVDSPIIAVWGSSCFAKSTTSSYLTFCSLSKVQLVCVGWFSMLNLNCQLLSTYSKLIIKNSWKLDLRILPRWLLLQKNLNSVATIFYTWMIQLFPLVPESMQLFLAKVGLVS